LAIGFPPWGTAINEGELALAMANGRFEPTLPLVLLLVLGCVAAGQAVPSLSGRTRAHVALGTTALAGLALAWLHLFPIN
jgi:hypothetical protein